MAGVDWKNGLVYLTDTGKKARTQKINKVSVGKKERKNTLDEHAATIALSDNLIRSER